MILTPLTDCPVQQCGQAKAACVIRVMLVCDLFKDL